MGSHEEYAAQIGKKADAAFLQASRKVIKRARDTDTLIVIWENNQMKKLTPDEMEARLEHQLAAQKSTEHATPS